MRRILLYNNSISSRGTMASWSGGVTNNRDDGTSRTIWEHLVYNGPKRRQLIIIPETNITRHAAWDPLTFEGGLRRDSIERSPSNAFLRSL